MLDALEIPPAWLPPVLESPRVSGTPRPEFRGGRRRRQAAARSASASTGPGPLSVVLGTSGVVFAALPGVRADAAGARRTSSATPCPDTWHAMGVMLSAAGLAALAARRARAGRAFDELIAEAATLAARAPRACSSCPTCRASGRRTRTRTRAARSPGSQLRHDRGALVRAVLEGVAFGLRDSLDLLRELGVERVERAGVRRRRAQRSSGCEIVASVLGLPLERTVVEEGSAFGAALLGGVAGGVFADVHEAVAAAVHTKDVVEPDPEWARVYGEQQHRYRALYPALRDLERSTVEG